VSTVELNRFKRGSCPIQGAEAGFASHAPTRN
jgi:hypothetical protein